MSYSNIIHNQTVQKYYEAIQKLVAEHPVSAISVQMILEETKTSRQTFYNYFQDKYDLMNYVYYRDGASYVDTMFNSHEDFQTTLYFANKQIQNKGEYYKKICTYEGQNCFKEFHIAHWNSIYSKLLGNYYGNKFDARMQHSLMVYVTGLTELVIEWMKSGCDSITHKQISDLCIQYNFPELQAVIDDLHK